jgi:hypothetical protein
MIYRLLSIIVVVALFIVMGSDVNGGAAQARGGDEIPAAPTCFDAITVTNANDSGAGSLRQAMVDVCAGGTITFNGDYHIVLSSSLSIGTHMTIDGAGHSVSLDGNNAALVIGIPPSTTLNLQNLSVTNGHSTGCGGGIGVSGVLNATNVYFAYNGAGSGGGICGVPIFSAPIITVTNSTFYYNSASNGGAIYTNSGNVTVSGSTFWDNSASVNGGAIKQTDGGTTVVTNSTFLLNTAAGTYGGGAIFSEIGDLSVVNSTFSGNTNSVAAIVFWDGNLTFYNSIVRHSSPRNCSFVRPASSSIANNLADDNSCDSGFTNSSSILLGSLGSYGGSTQTFPLLPGSAAINGTSSHCPATDQRGIARGSTCDIGAFESRGFTLTVSGGNNQATLVNTTFADPLQLSVGSAYGEPVNGGVVTFAGPSSGASINPSSNVIATIGGGNVSQTVSANGIGGSYPVTATANGASDVYFSLTNNKYDTTTSLTLAPSPSVYGQAVTFTATVTSTVSTPSGSVQLYVAGSPLGAPLVLTGGQTTVTTSTLSGGSHPITATYSGSESYNASTSGVLTQVVNTINTTTSLTSAPNPSAYGQAVTFTATVTAANGTPTGAISFTLDSTTMVLPLNGLGITTYTTNTLSVGQHTVSAIYGGDTNFNASSGILSGGQTVEPVRVFLPLVLR